MRSFSERPRNRINKLKTKICRISKRTKKRRNYSLSSKKKVKNLSLSQIDALNQKLKKMVEDENLEKRKEKVLKNLPYFMKKARELKNLAGTEKEHEALILYYNNLSNCCLSINAIKKALEIVEWVLKQIIISDFFILSIIYHTKGSIMKRMGKFSEAVKCFRKAYEKAQTKINITKLQIKKEKEFWKIEKLNFEMNKTVELILRIKISEISILSKKEFLSKNFKFIIFEISKIKKKYFFKLKKQTSRDLQKKISFFYNKALFHKVRISKSQSVQTESGLFTKKKFQPKFEASFSNSIFTQPQTVNTYQITASNPQNPSSPLKNTVRRNGLFRSTLSNIFTPAEKLKKNRKLNGLQNSLCTLKFGKGGNETTIGLGFNPAASWYNSPMPMNQNNRNIGLDDRKKFQDFKNSKFKQYSNKQGGDTMKVKVIKRSRSGPSPHLSKFKSLRSTPQRGRRNQKRAKSGFFFREGFKSGGNN